MKKSEQAALLRSAASALEHGRTATASKKIQQALGGPLVIFVEGGVVQDVGRVNTSGFLAVEHEVMDYDILEGNSDEDVQDYFERRSPELKAYMEKFLPDEFQKFQLVDSDLCDCADRSWYGEVHDSACALAGQPNPNSLLKS
jgi:hypothetical protein